MKLFPETVCEVDKAVRDKASSYRTLAALLRTVGRTADAKEAKEQADDYYRAAAAVKAALTSAGCRTRKSSAA